MGWVEKLLLTLIRACIRAYQILLSPLLGQRCRYYPSCSAYALEAMHVHGLARGLGLALRRVLRCHPGHAGGLDPVPPSATGAALNVSTGSCCSSPAKD